MQKSDRNCSERIYRLLTKAVVAQKDEEQEKKFDGDVVDDWVICYAISNIASGLHFEMKLMARGSKSFSFDFLFISFPILIKKFSSRLAGVFGASRYKSQMEKSPKNLLIVFGAQSLSFPSGQRFESEATVPLLSTGRLQELSQPRHLSPSPKV